jgi:hypothetical protein
MSVLYIKNALGEFEPVPALMGPTGPEGSIGPTGPTGPVGISFTYGTEEPSGGSDGDLYFKYEE